MSVSALSISKSYYLANRHRCPNPKCGSDDIETHDRCFDSDCAWERIGCNECGWSWEETYVFDTIDTVYDEHGDEIEVLD